jgi:hypothetical protein
MIKLCSVILDTMVNQTESLGLPLEYVRVRGYIHELSVQNYFRKIRTVGRLEPRIQNSGTGTLWYQILRYQYVLERVM